MSHPRPGGRRRGLPVLTPLVVIGILTGGAALVPGWLSHATVKPTGNALPQQPPATATSSLASSVPVAAAPNPTATSDSGLPAGTLFDSFHYTGPNDTTLAAHGWQARDGEGGPGVQNTWSASGVSFPKVSSAQGGRALQLDLATDGTPAGTRQAQLLSTAPRFFTGTIAARVYFSDKPSAGSDGDHINETFYLISAKGGSAADYSELDYEYMPNGGGASKEPRLDNVSWRSAKSGDRVYRSTLRDFKGWHTLMIIVADGAVTYSIDGDVLFRSNGKSYPRERTGIQFSTWFVNLPFTGSRSWDMYVNWVYCKDGQTQTLTQVQNAVKGFYAKNTDYVDTMPKT